MAYPQLSAEGVIELDPGVIVDLVSHIERDKKSMEKIVHQWDRLHVVRAVRDGQVHVIVGDYALRPGPRYIEFLEELTHLLHPEAFEEEKSVD